jgi:hypothetical protein
MSVGAALAPVGSCGLGVTGAATSDGFGHSSYAEFNRDTACSAARDCDSSTQWATRNATADDSPLAYRHR